MTGHVLVSHTAFLVCLRILAFLCILAYFCILAYLRILAFLCILAYFCILAYLRILAFLCILAYLRICQDVQIIIPEDLRHFRSGEFSREHLPFFQQFADTGAAQRKAEVLRVGTGAGCCRLAASPAIKGIIKPENSYSQFVSELLAKILGLVGAVILAGAGMVPADNHMGAPVILSYQGVKNRFPWAGVTHSRGEYPQQDPVPGVIILQ